jgi:hypothetical protein
MPPVYRTMLLAAGGLLACLPAHAAVIPIVNGDFEAYPYPGYPFPADGGARAGHEIGFPGWSGGSGTQVWNPSEAQLRNADAHGFVAGIPTQAGSQSALYNQRNPGMLSQIVPDVLLQANTRYTLTLDVATDNSQPNWAYDFGLISGDLGANAGPILARLTGRTDSTGAVIPTAQFRTISLVFDTGVDTIGIGKGFAIGLAGLGASNQRIAYDNIRLDATPLAGPVPEPASWAMMIAGFGLVGGAMRRRTVRACIAV